MEQFTQLFGRLLAWVYHCFDRIVLPRFAAGIPVPTRLFHVLPQFHFGKAHPNGYQCVVSETRCGRVPIALCAVAHREPDAGHVARRCGIAHPSARPKGDHPGFSSSRVRG
jgi:hypothetical protein